MKVRDLKELLETVPDYWEVGILVEDGDDTDFLCLEGPADERWTHSLPLLVKDSFRKVKLK